MSKDTRNTDPLGDSATLDDSSTLDEEMGGSFTLQNDESPPGMEHVIQESKTAAVSKLGVSSTAKPLVFQDYQYVTHDLDDEPDTYVRGISGEDDDFTEYSPEDAKHHFFTSQEMQISTKYIQPCGGGGKVADIEQPSKTNCSSDVPIHYNDDKAGCKPKRKNCLKIAAFLIGFGAVLLVLYLSSVMDPVLGKGDSSTNSTANSTTPAPTMAPSQPPGSTAAPSLPSGSTPGSTTTDPTTTQMAGEETTVSTPAASPSPSTTATTTTTIATPTSPPSPTTTAAPVAAPTTTAAPATVPVTSSTTTAATVTTPTTTTTTTVASPPTATVAPPTSLFEAYSASDVGGAALQGTNANDYYGSSIAISDSGTVLVVADAKRTIRRCFWNDTTWEAIPSEPLILPTDSNNNNNNSTSLRVTLSGNGNILAVAELGSVATYSWNSIQWNSIGLFTTTATIPQVALSYDGTVLVTGEPQFNQTAGRVKRYQWVPTAQLWAESPGFVVTVPTPGQQMGASLSLSSDGTIVAIGSVGGSTTTGQVRVYQYNNATQTTTSIDSAVAGTVTNQGFGKQVLYNKETGGTIMAVLSKSGGVDIYRLNGSGKRFIAVQSITSQKYNQLAMGFDGTRFTAFLGYTTCNNNGNGGASCLDTTNTTSAKTAWMEAWDSDRSNYQTWTRTTQKLLGEPLLNNDPTLQMAVARETAQTLVAGLPGADASLGTVYVYHKQGGIS